MGTAQRACSPKLTRGPWCAVKAGLRWALGKGWWKGGEPQGAPVRVQEWGTAVTPSLRQQPGP